jgi:hypothetical protein
MDSHTFHFSVQYQNSMSELLIVKSHTNHFVRDRIIERDNIRISAGYLPGADVPPERLV